LTVSSYIEANPLRAGLARRAEDWKWSSLSTDDSIVRPELSEGPVSRPADWIEWVNLGASRDELNAVRRSVRRGRPFGDDAWTFEIAQTYGLDFTVRRPGRPQKNRDTQLFAKTDNDVASSCPLFEKS
jgi:putative transposase